MTGATQASTRATQFDLANRGKVSCGSVLGDEFLPNFLRNLVIRHLQICHNAPIPPPPLPAQILHNQVASHFSWVLQPSQEKLKTMLMQNLGEQIRSIMGKMEVAFSDKRVPKKSHSALWHNIDQSLA